MTLGTIMVENFSDRSQYLSWAMTKDAFDIILLVSLAAPTTIAYGSGQDSTVTKKIFFPQLNTFLVTAYEPDEVVVSAFKVDDTEGNIADPMKDKFNDVILKSRH